MFHHSLQTIWSADMARQDMIHDVNLAASYVSVNN